MILFRGAEKELDDWAGHADLTPKCCLVNVARLYMLELLLFATLYIAIKNIYIMCI